MLPNLYRDVKSQGLARVVAEHLEETKGHAARLEEVFRSVGAEPSSTLSAPVAKLAEHRGEVAAKIVDDRLGDVFHAAAAATTEHHELAAYDAVLVLGTTFRLGDTELLQRNRDQDAAMLGKLEGELERLATELLR